MPNGDGSGTSSSSGQEGLRGRSDKRDNTPPLRSESSEKRWQRNTMHTNADAYNYAPTRVSDDMSSSRGAGEGLSNPEKKVTTATERKQDNKFRSFEKQHELHMEEYNRQETRLNDSLSVTQDQELRNKIQAIQNDTKMKYQLEEQKGSLEALSELKGTDGMDEGIDLLNDILRDTRNMLGDRRKLISNL